MAEPAIEYDKKKQYTVLTMNTLAFTVNFAVWTMFAVIGIKIKQEPSLNETEFSLLVAVSIDATGAPRLALTVFILFYMICLFITWWWYRREGAEVRCD